MIHLRIASIAFDISRYDQSLGDEMMIIAEGLKPRKRWKKHTPIDRRKRRKWLRSPAGKRYQKHKQLIEHKPSIKRKRKKYKNRGIHHQYHWL